MEETGRMGALLPPGLFLLAVAFATPLWPLTALFNSHTVAALLVFAGFHAGLLADRPCLAGLALGFAATVDLPLGLLALALVAAVSPARVRLAMAAAPPLVLHLGLNRLIVGDFVPFQMHRELYTAATGHTGASATGFAQDQGLAFYAARNLVGSIGVPQKALYWNVYQRRHSVGPREHHGLRVPL